MGIIEEIVTFLGQKQYTVRMPYARESITREIDSMVRGLLERATARIRELEGAVERLTGADVWGPCPLAPTVTGLLRRIEALEAHEEARGRLEAEAVPPGSPPAPPTDMASRCAGCGGFIRVEGARCGVCRGGAPDLTAVIQPLREAAPEPKPSFGHCPHTLCCHCSRRDGGCPGEGTKVMLEPSLGDDMRYESRGS